VFVCMYVCVLARTPTNSHRRSMRCQLLLTSGVSSLLFLVLFVSVSFTRRSLLCEQQTAPCDPVEVLTLIQYDAAVIVVLCIRANR
jgi:hypothetical protein